VPPILQRLPYSGRRTPVLVRGRQIEVKPTQIIVWVSITESGERSLDRNAPRFPAILDTGLSHNFAIKEELLSQWAGIDPRYLSKLHDISIRGQVVPLHGAEVWLHPNQPGERNQFANRPSFRLWLESGIAVYPKDVRAAPRLPFLGLRGLEWTELQVSIDCKYRHLSIRTSRRFWFFDS
jgi:hypothetical protein